MKLVLLFSVIVSFAMPTFAAAPLTGFPFADESLAYSINWPGGSLGAAHLTARHTATGWSFGFSVDASVPGYAVKDSYEASANTDLCSSDFSRMFSHGPRKGGEKEAIDRSQETVERVTSNGGGKSEFPIPDCLKDALTFLFYSRQELGQGRVPAAQQILFGGLYDARLDYAGAQTIQVGGKPAQSDKIVCSLKGPNSSIQFDIYFARDPARTPLLLQVPLSMGKFSMELVR